MNPATTLGPSDGSMLLRRYVEPELPIDPMVNRSHQRYRKPNVTDASLSQ